jgi:hypothetical protein
MFDIGEIVIIIGSDGRGPVPDAPPAMILNKYYGFPSAGVEGSGDMIVYDILFMGRIEYAISGEWLEKVDKLL